MVRGDIDGFYGEPAEYDAALEVELTLVERPTTARVIALEDEWFDFDDTKELEREWEDDVPTTTWQRFGGWLQWIGSRRLALRVIRGPARFDFVVATATATWNRHEALTVRRRQQHRTVLVDREARDGRRRLHRLGEPQQSTEVEVGREALVCFDVDHEALPIRRRDDLEGRIAALDRKRKRVLARMHRIDRVRIGEQVRETHLRRAVDLDMRRSHREIRQVNEQHAPTYCDRRARPVREAARPLSRSRVRADTAGPSRRTRLGLNGPSPLA